MDVADTVDAAQVISSYSSAAAAHHHHVTFSIEENMQLLDDALRSLPPHAVDDLLSLGVCARCIFRLFGFHGHVYFVSSFSRSMISNIIGQSAHLGKHLEGSSDLNVDGDSGDLCATQASEDASELCCICLGILQFTYVDEKGMRVKMEAANDLAASIAELVKQQGHLIDNFTLEVSIPPIIQENENVVWSYVKRKYGSEVWFQERLSECISTKDALKLSIASLLETLLDVKSGPSPFRIRLIYAQTKPSSLAPNAVKRNGGLKRRKTGTNNGLGPVSGEFVDAGSEHLDSSAARRNTISERSSNIVEGNESSEGFDLRAERVYEPCYLEFLCYRTPIYLGGRYLKFSRNVSQTCWIIDDERMGEASVEEIIGGNILPICRGDIYKFHAAGREDIDVRMLGSGRPFLVEIQNARQVPSMDTVKEIETKINNLENKLVGVKNLKVVTNDGWALIHEGESEKQKQYCALVWISRPFEDEDLQSISSFKDMQILQRTPIRVLHRRSPLDRAKIIHWMKIERIAGSSQYFLLHLCTQAGTYIKEFVHGDLGRTHPSIGSILGCRAEILQLDVMDVKMDCFLDE